MNKFRKIYCKRKWDQVSGSYRIPEEERKVMAERLAKKEGEVDNIRFYMYNVPMYRYKDKEYLTVEGFWKSNAKKELALCDQPNCDWWNDRQAEMKRKRQEYGFMNGLHIFEVKSDKDKHDLLIHQIPNMVAMADYVWLVLGENQPTPKWLPPYISVLRFKNGKFQMEYKHQIDIRYPPTYKDALKSQGFEIKSKEEYALHRLLRKWRINSMFHYQFEGNTIIDMQKEIEILLSFLRRADNNKSKDDYKLFQQNLFKYIDDSSNKGI
jgi:hypothetical protein